MIFRTKTSKKTMEIFEAIGTREHLQPFALSKISIALAIKNNSEASFKILGNTGFVVGENTISENSKWIV